MNTPSSSTPLLTPFQKKVLAFAITFASFLAIVGFVVFSFKTITEGIIHFNKVLWPVVVAGILSLLLKPLINHIQNRLQLSTGASIIFLYFALLVIIGISSSLLFPLILEQAVRFFYFLPTLIDSIGDFVKGKFPSILEFLDRHLPDQNLLINNLHELLDTIKQILISSLPAITNFSKNLFGLFAWSTALVIIPIYLFYFLRANEGFLNILERETAVFKGRWASDLVFLVKEFSEILVAFFRGQLLIALIMGVLLSTGFSIIGLQFSIVLGLTFGLLNIIPYLGSILGLITILPIAYFQESGGLFKVLLAIIIISIVQITEGYLLTPKIMGKQTGLHPAMIVFSVFFWGTALNGILGMILAIPLSAFLVVFWRLLQNKYLHANTSEA